MSHFVYIVRCKDNSYYTGICFDLKSRITAHNNGLYKGSFTKCRLPVKLVYLEKLASKIDAARREKVIKDFSRIKKEKLINNLNVRGRKSLLRTK